MKTFAEIREKCWDDLQFKGHSHTGPLLEQEWKILVEDAMDYEVTIDRDDVGVFLVSFSGDSNRTMH